MWSLIRGSYTWKIQRKSFRKKRQLYKRGCLSSGWFFITGSTLPTEILLLFSHLSGHAVYIWSPLVLMKFSVFFRSWRQLHSFFLSSAPLQPPLASKIIVVWVVLKNVVRCLGSYPTGTFTHVGRLEAATYFSFCDAHMKNTIQKQSLVSGPVALSTKNTIDSKSISCFRFCGIVYEEHN